MSTLDKPQINHDEQEPSEKYGASTNTTENDPHTDLTTILKTRPVNTWSRGSLHLYAVCLLVYLCSTMNGMLEMGRILMFR